jgi:hypothetical protein
LAGQLHNHFDNNIMSEEEEEEDHCLHPCKKLRAADPDLQIILHFPGPNEGDPPQTKEYPCYSQMLCAVSEFIDTALSVGMEEKETRVIHMHDFHPSVFEPALHLVLDPLKYRRHIDRTNSWVAVQLLPFYNLYGFDSGRQICDEAIAREFQLTDDNDDAADELPDHWSTWCRASDQNNLDLLLTTTVMADELHLPAASKIITRYVNLHMSTHSERYDIEHIEKLHPMLKNGHFLEAVKPATFRPDEIDSSLFPKLFLTLLTTVRCKNCWYYRVRTRTHSILVEGAGVERVNGRYTLKVEEDGETVYVRTLDDGQNEVRLVRTAGSARGLWKLKELIPTGVSRGPLYRAYIQLGTRCEDCRAFPPLESRHWRAVDQSFLPVPKLSLLE